MQDFKTWICAPAGGLLCAYEGHELQLPGRQVAVQAQQSHAREGRTARHLAQFRQGF